MNSAVIVKALTKQYVLGSEILTHTSFRELIVGTLTSPFKKYKRLSGKDNQQTKFLALNDISFSAEPGEVIGIIGRNGAGKSTLLKVLSRITTPSSGTIEYRGKTASLLEVGTGFHPDLTGRENIYLNGSILGMSLTEINEQFDDIVAFAEIEKFLDTPVKRYSSGMYVRLAFSIAAHVDNDILIIDEVLSVGDQAFQQKCLGKVKDTAKSGRTVFMVSHNMTTIRSLCSRILYLKEGQLEFDGDPAKAISAYLASNKSSNSSWQDERGEHQHLKHFAITNSEAASTNIFQYSEKIRAEFYLENMREDRTAAAIRVTDMMGNIVCTSRERDHLTQIQYARNTSVKLNCELPAQILKPGEYTLTALVRKVTDAGSIIFEEANLDITISNEDCPIPEGRLGLIAPILRWHYESSD